MEVTKVIIDFPEPRWGNSANIELASEQLREWLYCSGSFIERLKQQGISQPVITVLKHDWDIPLVSERSLLQLASTHLALVREVLIENNGMVWMYARTIFPANTLTGREQIFLSLEDQSLGSILFNYPNLQRSLFEFACIEKQSEWYKKISKWVTLTDEQMWARRSIFTIEQKSILLSEVFLPAMKQL